MCWQQANQMVVIRIIGYQGKKTMLVTGEEGLRDIQK